MNLVRLESVPVNTYRVSWTATTVEHFEVDLPADRVAALATGGADLAAIIADPTGAGLADALASVDAEPVSESFERHGIRVTPVSAMGRELTQDEADALALWSYGNPAGEPWRTTDLTTSQLAQLAEIARGNGLWIATMDAAERWVASGATQTEALANLESAWNQQAQPTITIDNPLEYFGAWTYFLAPGRAYQDDRPFTIGNPS